MRNPCSSFTFTNYLFQKGRLASYINRDSSIPSRREWSAYLAWCACRMQAEVPGVVVYGQEVISVSAEEVNADGTPVVFRVAVRDTASGAVRTLRARNVCVGVGGVPQIPPPLQTAYASRQAHIVHSGHFLPSLATLRTELATRNGLRLAVVGSGQSAAEMTLHLYNTFPTAEIDMVFRAPAIKPSDDSSFVNAAAFDPESTDTFWKASRATRQKWREEFGRTNYAVVRSNVLNQLFTISYDDKIELEQPLDGADGPASGHITFQANTSIVQAESLASGRVRLTVHNSTMAEGETMIDYDAVFLGTGFARQLGSLKCLEPLGEHYPAIVQSEAERVTNNKEFDEPRETDSDEEAERIRMRNRGVGRDYRLVAGTSSIYRRAGAAVVDEAASSGSSSPATSRSPTSEAHAYSQSTTAVNSRRESSTFSPTNAALAALSGIDGRSHSVDSEQTLGSRRASPVSSGNHERQRQREELVLRLSSEDAGEGNVYVMGCNESTHGLSDSLLSISAHRAGEIAKSLFARIDVQHQIGRGDKVTAAVESTQRIGRATSAQQPKEIGSDKDEEEKTTGSSVSSLANQLKNAILGGSVNHLSSTTTA